MSENVILPTLSARQRLALNSLAGGESRQSAAAAANISPRQLERWLRQPEFLKELNVLASEVLSATTTRLTAASASALDVLTDLYKDPDQPAAIRLRAATVILDRLLALKELNDHEERLNKLEKEGLVIA